MIGEKRKIVKKRIALINFESHLLLLAVIIFQCIRFYAGCLVFLWFVFQSQDVAFLEKLIKDDIERGKLPLLLVANAGRYHEPESSILDIQERG